MLGLVACAGEDTSSSLSEREQLVVGTMEAGSLIIPMDTLSQDHGMLRAYGLVYRLLSQGVPVYWAVAEGKAQNGVDFSAPTKNRETGASLGMVSYRGGPFIVAAADRAAALPLVDAWLADDCVTVVHEAVAPFLAEQTRHLASAPRLAVGLDRYQSIAFKNFNAAGIPDSTGAAWSMASPDLLDEDELSGTADSGHDGALWNADGGPAFCHLTFTYYWANKTKTAQVVRELREWLGPGNLTHLFAQAESLRAIESSPHGLFLTTAGLTDDGGTPWTTSTWTPSEPLAQVHGSFRGISDVMDSIGLLPGSQFHPATSRMIGSASAPAAQSRLLLLSGPRDGDAANGRATYLAGFDYGTELPISSHPWTNGLRVLLGSVLASECNLAENQPQVRLTPSAATAATSQELTFSIAYRNDGPGFATGATLEASLPAGTSLVSASGAGALTGGVVRWTLATLLPGETGNATFTVVASTAGTYTTQLALRYRAGVTARSVTGSQAGSVGSSELPDTLFLAVPPSPTDATDALFALASDLSPVTFECSLDGAAFAPCATPLALAALAPGEHTLAARAVSGLGADPSPASHTWRINATPTARPDAASVPEDSGAILLSVLDNDTLGDAPTTLVAFTAATHGAVQQVGQQLTYTPLANYHGPDSFSYTIRDADDQTSTATVELEVLSVDDLPVAQDDDASVQEDGEALISVLGNDSGLGDAPVTVLSVSAPFHGTAAVIGHRVAYTPAPNYHGPELVSYTLVDADGDQATAQVVITVTPVNDVPVAHDDATAVIEDGAADLPVLANDQLGDAPAAVIAVSSPAHGAAVLGDGGVIRYTPAGDYAGSDAFTYTVADADGETASATVTVQVVPDNDVPEARDDVATTSEDQAVTVAVLANDLGLGDAPVSIAAVTAPARGVVTVAGDALVYTPAPGLSGSDSLSYTVVDGDGQTSSATVSITVLAVDDVPAAGDDSFTVAEDTAGALLPVLANDQLGDTPTTLTYVSPPPHGTVVVLGDQVVYTPSPDYAGLDLFTYEITDADGQVASATVSIDVTEVDDLPTAVDDAAAVLGDQSVLVAVLANDLGLGDGPVTLLSVSTPAVGSASIEGQAVRYTPVRTIGGEVSFSYTLRDGDGDTATATVRVAVTAVNSTPVALDDVATVLEDGVVLVAVRANDSGGDAPVVLADVSDPPRGTAVRVGDEVRYTPDANYSGTDSFTYTLQDEDGETATATVTVTVTAVNDTPSAQTDNFVVIEDSGATLLSVLANDLGIGDAPLTVTLVAGSIRGTAVVVGNQIQYTPNANYSGTDNFMYRVRDADGQSSTATAFLSVTAVNDPPTAVNDTFTATAGVVTTLNVLANDRDVDGNPLTLASVGVPSTGTVTISANQAVFTAPSGFVGAATFTYVLSDGRGGTATATVTVNVAAPAALPSGAAASISGSSRPRVRLQ
ncbi:MAG: tandem-95 repeat protein [Myxococcales bacterium]|nr:tandem-95 repeat protein [Myxococcales bacterium]